VIRRERIRWPDAAPFRSRDGRPIRLLAASDEPDPALAHAVNRQSLGALDGIIGCGDLEPHWLAFLADAFQVPLVYVRGNHDRGGLWEERDATIPEPLPSGTVTSIAGIRLAGLEWPGLGAPRNERRSGLAWWHALRLLRHLLPLPGRRSEPVLVISHAPPLGAGDVPADAFHRGFSAYRWLLERLEPPVWLHGHSTVASVPALVTEVRSTRLVNVTGAVLVELLPPGGGSGPGPPG
jgi:uncharacterized protein